MEQQASQRPNSGDESFAVISQNIASAEDDVLEDLAEMSINDAGPARADFALYKKAAIQELASRAALRRAAANREDVAPLLSRHETVRADDFWGQLAEVEQDRLRKLDEAARLKAAAKAKLMKALDADMDDFLNEDQDAEDAFEALGNLSVGVSENEGSQEEDNDDGKTVAQGSEKKSEHANSFGIPTHPTTNGDGNQDNAAKDSEKKSEYAGSLAVPARRKTDEDAPAIRAAKPRPIATDFNSWFTSRSPLPPR